MKDIPAEMINFDVTKFQADLDFSVSSKNVLLESHYNYYPHSDPENYSVLIRALINAKTDVDNSFMYSCQLDAIFTYQEKPEDLGEWAKLHCFPVMQEKANEVFTSVLAALHKNVKM